MIFTFGALLTAAGLVLFVLYGSKPWSWLPFWCMPVGIVVMIDAIVAKLSLLH